MIARTGDPAKFGRIAVFGDINGYYGKGLLAPPAAMVKWAADHFAARQYSVGFCVGDLVNSTVDPAQVTAAKACWGQLTNKIIVDGNHESTVGNALNIWFPWAAYYPGAGDYTASSMLAAFPTFVESWQQTVDWRNPPYASIENSYHQFQLAGKTWGAITLSWWPGVISYIGGAHDVTDWANSICQRYPGVPKILMTHAYMAANGQRFNHGHDSTASQMYNPHDMAAGDDVSNRYDGEEIWQRVVKGNADIKLVFSGHDIWNNTYLRSANDAGTYVHQFGFSHDEVSSGGPLPNGSFMEFEIDYNNNSLTRRVISPSTGSEEVAPSLFIPSAF